MLAASISFFTVTALVPFCLFLVTLFGSFLGEYGEFHQFFLSKLTSFFPRITAEITEELKRIITYKGLGKVSLLLYGVLSYELFSSLESATNVIFKVQVKRSFIFSLVLSVTLITLVMAFLLISFGTASVISNLGTIRTFIPGFEIGSITGFLLRFVIPLLLVFLVVMTLYFFLPKRLVKVKHAASGALFTAVLLEAAKHLFTLYVVKVVRFGTIYGPLSAVVIFLLWMFYSSCIFLIGAEVVHNLGVSKKSTSKRR